MMNLTEIVDDIDDVGIKCLLIIDDLDDLDDSKKAVRSKEIVDRTSDDVDRHKINRRREKLEERGLVDSKLRDKRGDFSVRFINITERGHEAAEAIRENESEYLTLETRVEHLERGYSQLNRAKNDLETDVEDVRIDLVERIKKSEEAICELYSIVEENDLRIAADSGETAEEIAERVRERPYR